MDIKDMEIKDLKVMAYDVMVSIQKLQNDLVTINTFIAKKSQIKSLSIPEKKEKEKK